MKILTICPKSFASNTYLLVSGTSAMVVDPSVSIDAIEKELKNHNAVLIGALLTHGHFDHIISVDTLRERFRVPLYIHKNDACMLTDGRLNGFYIFFQRDCVHSPADRFFEDGDEIFIGDESIKILHTPGHSQGSSCFVFNDDNGESAIITGDTLFANSIGRCDLYGGSIQEIASSIKRLSTLDGSAKIYPGHDVSSTLGEALDNVSYILDF